MKAGSEQKWEWTPEQGHPQLGCRRDSALEDAFVS